MELFSEEVKERRPCLGLTFQVYKYVSKAFIKGVHPMFRKIPCTIMRGGTSKGVIFWEKDLPEEVEVRDRAILSIFGSPDPRQINGLGGADSLTSKCALIKPSSEGDFAYTIGNVSITTPVVDYSSNCGNLSSAVGAFAVDGGLVVSQEPITLVKMFNANTQKVILAEVPVRNGKFFPEGDYSISGVPGSGSKIMLDFKNTVGSVTNKILPTGRTREILDLGRGEKMEVSIIDVATPMVFLRAEDLSLKGRETADEINSNSELLKRIEEIRSSVAELIGVVREKKEATLRSPATPKIAFVAPAEFGLISRMMSMQKLHKAYAVTGAICTAVAAKIEGSLVHEIFKEKIEKKAEVVRIGHPSGFIDVEIEVHGKGEDLKVKRAAVARTARRIMDGYVYVST
jgi:2-methylaconitate cis-trans-isomerase PrpF